MFSRGWDMYLYTLGQYLQHFPGRPATYVEAEAPAFSTERDGWAHLAPALGLNDPVAVGNWVYIDLGGVGPVDGVIDYLTPTFLGVRTADALLRFHHRSAIGMPIAVSHHVYADDINRVALEKAWQGWLAELSRPG